MISTEELKKRKFQLESALRDVNLALNHDEYAKPFHFKRMDTFRGEDVKSPVLRSIYKKCVQNGSGFDPNLITQHIERESLEQFNEIVTAHIKGKSIKDLMELRHELELLMLNERFDHYNNEIEKVNKMIAESVTKGESVAHEKKEKVKGLLEKYMEYAKKSKK